jgi:hypothetical protein
VPSAVCYLCGKPLTKPIDGDHVPPKQLFAHSIRKKHPTNLLRIATHAACNQSYQFDEDYFVNTLAPFARGSYSGNAVLTDIFDKFHKGEKVGLIKKVLSEFERRPSGLVLPKGKVIKRFEGKRLNRVLLKIVRGLYFHHYGEVLPEELTADVTIVSPDSPPPEHFLMALGDKQEHGRHQGVFAYKFTKFPEVNNFHYWGMLFWDRIIAIAMFHDPACRCAECTGPAPLSDSGD